MTMLTEESNPRTTALDSYSALEIVTAMNAEDATVATAVRGALPRSRRPSTRLSSGCARAADDLRRRRDERPPRRAGCGRVRPDVQR